MKRMFNLFIKETEPDLTNSAKLSRDFNKWLYQLRDGQRRFASTDTVNRHMIRKWLGRWLNLQLLLPSGRLGSLQFKYKEG